MCWPCVVRGGRGKTADAPAVLAAAGAAAAVPGKRNKKQGPRGPCFLQQETIFGAQGQELVICLLEHSMTKLGNLKTSLK